MNPIFVECTMHKHGIIVGHLMKVFELVGDFNAWYKDVKNDQSLILNIMYYNPVEKARLKDVYDVKLLGVDRVSREKSI